MSIFDLISNTVEGAIQAPLGAAKATVGVLTAPLDQGETIQDGLENMVEGVQKIGDADAPPNCETGS